MGFLDSFIGGANDVAASQLPGVRAQARASESIARASDALANRATAVAHAIAAERDNYRAWYNLSNLDNLAWRSVARILMTHEAFCDPDAKELSFIEKYTLEKAGKPIPIKRPQNDEELRLLFLSERKKIYDAGMRNGGVWPTFENNGNLVQPKSKQTLPSQILDVINAK